MKTYETQHGLKVIFVRAGSHGGASMKCNEQYGDNTFRSTDFCEAPRVDGELVNSVDRCIFIGFE